MNFDVAAWCHAESVCTFAIGSVRVGEMQRQMESAVGKFVIDGIDAFGSFVITLAIFGTEGLAAKRNLVGLYDLVALHEGKSA